MRLVHAATHEFHEFIGEDIPPYAILSHTWDDEEVTFNDLWQHRTAAETWKTKRGWKKIEWTCRQALKDGIEFVWVDTCCIDKSSSAELQEAINSMFRWYALSTECYVFLTDFEWPHFESDEYKEGSAVGVEELKDARWWTRGWTLQELLAPESVRFFDSQWSKFGDKVSMRHEIAAITGISEDILLGTILGARQAIDSISIAQRMSWAAHRVTTRVEDTAYCLLGIFDVNMPLLYGEGAKAFQRLQEEIMKASPDQSLLAWCTETPSLWGVSWALAESPADFAQCGTMMAWGAAKPGDKFKMTQRGLSLNLPVALSLDDGNLIYCALNCTIAERVPPDGNIRAARVLAVPLLRHQTRTDGDNPHVDEYYRLLARMPIWVERTVFDTAPRTKVYLPSCLRHGFSLYERMHISMDLAMLPAGYYIAGVFPPEKSRNDCVVIRPRVSDSAAAVLVHFASISPALPGFLLVLEFEKSPKEPWESAKLGSEFIHVPEDELQQRASSQLQQPFTRSALRDNVFRVIASEVGCPIHELSEEASLQDLGVDSLLSLSIATQLMGEFNVLLDAWMFLGSKTISDVLKRLNFVTRPSYSLLSGGWPQIGRLSRLPTPRFRIETARYCVIEVARQFSLSDVGAESFWIGLPFMGIEFNHGEATITTTVDSIVLKLVVSPMEISISSLEAAGAHDVNNAVDGRVNAKRMKI